MYRDLILETEEPLLSDVIRKLGQLAEQERSFGAEGAPDTRDIRKLVGQIDSSESLVIQQMRRIQWGTQHFMRRCWVSGSFSEFRRMDRHTGRCESSQHDGLTNESQVATV